MFVSFVEDKKEGPHEIKKLVQIAELELKPTMSASELLRATATPYYLDTQPGSARSVAKVNYFHTGSQ